MIKPLAAAFLILAALFMVPLAAGPALAQSLTELGLIEMEDSVPMLTLL